MIEGWDIAMSRYLQDCSRKTFEWGVFDCCIFTADCINLITGIDYMAEFRGKYSTQEEALSLLDTSLVAVMQAKFGRVERVGARGDIAMKYDVDGPALGICFGSKSIFVGEDGLKVISNNDCRFWKVPHDG